jgi:hypothetical protein
LALAFPVGTKDAGSRPSRIFSLCELLLSTHCFGGFGIKLPWYDSKSKKILT